MFIKRESYKHLYAKKVLAKWCREAEKKSEYCRVAQFFWRANYGVFKELPFYETSDPYYFECSKGLAAVGDGPWDMPEKCFIKGYDHGKILFVPDITIFHKGTASYLFEIIHSNPVSDEKIKRIKLFFRYHPVEVYEIESEIILRQMQVPEIIKCRRVI